MAVSVSVSAPPTASIGRPFTATIVVANDSTSGDQVVTSLASSLVVLRPGAKLPGRLPYFLGGSQPTASYALQASFFDARRIFLAAGANKSVDLKFIVHAAGNYLVSAETASYLDTVQVPPAYVSVQVT